ncbi:MAG: dipeptide/oligopeptide/nickel ABC transporter ATP-binding protein [Bifidobacteriaceae bacterium]|jgi:peptide/nickel transport system ATP-binding protein|nr:dipeptide/oligopeptide/nickel ABC transporter ATP-binding protein [Bifidobacteriaceae bacterium]
MAEPILELDGLDVTFPGRRGHSTTVVHGVSLRLQAGETLSLVGESGSGKTTIGRAILGLAPVSRGTIRFRGKVISNVPRRERRALARDIQVVFQDPYSSLNPSMRVEDIIVEPMAAAGAAGGRQRVRELLDSVGLPSDAAHRYPREFSGGQRQRVAIARALALDPSVIICDEPTSALDVTTQAKVLTLLADLQKATGVAYLFISHDLGVVNSISDRIAVLKDGRIVEVGPARQVAFSPSEEYTRALQMAAPVADPAKQRQRRLARAAARSGGPTPGANTEPNAGPNADPDKSADR